MNLTNIHILLKRLFWVYILYTLSRVVFFVVNFSFLQQFHATEIVGSFLVGLRFDTTAIIYTNGVFILLHILPHPFRSHSLYQKILKWLFIIVNSLALLLNLIDAGYYQFSGKRSGAELLSMRKDISDQGVQYIKDYWYLALLLVGTIWILFRVYPKYPTTKQPLKISYLMESILFIGCCGLMILGARGSIGLKPLNTLDAARLTQPGLAALTLNTPFQFIMTVQQTGVAEKRYMSIKAAASRFNFMHLNPDAQPTRKNIVLIIVESLGKEYVGLYNNGKGYTPFLDSLAHYSTVYQHAYANGKRSIEGIPAIVAAMPSLMDNDYMNSYYQSNALESTGGLLQAIGYQTSFYHGGKNGTMSFDNFISATKAGTYYGANEYPDPKDNDGNWGVYDEPYLQYFSRQLDKGSKPFFSTVFTLSSHHPYNIPEAQKGLFPEGSLPIHKTIRYVDFALKRFFETAQQSPWYENTVFIITADHSSTNEQANYASMEGMYRIPLLVFDPTHPVVQLISKTTQQIDLMPQILNIAGYGKPYFSFGLSSSDSNGFAIQYINNVYQFIQHPYVLQFDGDKTVHFYKLNNKDVLEECNEADRRMVMENSVKAFIQQYNAALIHNQTSLQR
ncbi:MAG: LTA synthase family protein [Bacteroidota bacterium]